MYSHRILLIMFYSFEFGLIFLQETWCITSKNIICMCYIHKYNVSEIRYLIKLQNLVSNHLMLIIRGLISLMEQKSLLRKIYSFFFYFNSKLTLTIYFQKIAVIS